MQSIFCVVGILLVAVAAGSAPAAAKTCKEPVVVQFRTAVQSSPQAREKRARASVIDKWRDQSRAKYGIAYRFWSRSNDRSIECAAAPKSTTCKATATPCRLI